MDCVLHCLEGHILCWGRSCKSGLLILWRTYFLVWVLFTTAGLPYSVSLEFLHLNVAHYCWKGRDWIFKTEIRELFIPDEHTTQTHTQVTVQETWKENQIGPRRFTKWEKHPLFLFVILNYILQLILWVMVPNTCYLPGDVKIAKLQTQPLILPSIWNLETGLKLQQEAQLREQGDRNAGFTVLHMTRSNANYPHFSSDSQDNPTSPNSLPQVSDRHSAGNPQGLFMMTQEQGSSRI